jgi:hypothetical protein
MGFILAILFAENLDQVVHFFANHLLVYIVAHVFETHKEGKLANVALKPNIVYLLRVVLLMSVQVPSVESLLQTNRLFLMLVQTD